MIKSWKRISVPEEQCKRQIQPHKSWYILAAFHALQNRVGFDGNIFFTLKSSFKSCMQCFLLCCLIHNATTNKIFINEIDGWTNIQHVQCILIHIRMTRGTLNYSLRKTNKLSLNQPDESFSESLTHLLDCKPLLSVSHTKWIRFMYLRFMSTSNSWC